MFAEDNTFFNYTERQSYHPWSLIPVIQQLSTLLVSIGQVVIFLKKSIYIFRNYLSVHWWNIALILWSEAQKQTSNFLRD